MKITDTDFRPVLDAFFAQPNIFVKHQLDSYNNFVDKDIELITKQYSPYEFLVEKKGEVFNETLKNVKYFKVRIEVHDVELIKPCLGDISNEQNKLFPNDARNKNKTYSSSIYMIISFNVALLAADKSVIKVFKQEPTKEFMGNIPVMVGSKLCNTYGLSHQDLINIKEDPLEQVGYFIIEGNEKLVNSQEKLIENYIFMRTNNGPNDKYSPVAEIKSIRNNTEYHNASIKVKYKINDNCIYVTINPGFKAEDIPLSIVFRALGVETDSEITTSVTNGETKNRRMLDLLKPSIDATVKDVKTGNNVKILTREDALIWMAHNTLHVIKIFESEEKKIQYIKGLLDIYFVPHVIDNNPSIKMDKAKYLSIIVKKVLLRKMNLIFDDDRDDFANKRIDLTGDLYGQLYRTAYTSSLETLKKTITKELISKPPASNDAIKGLISRNKAPSQINVPFRRSMLTGTWSTNTKSASARVGVAQHLPKKSRLDPMRNLARIVTPKTSGASTQLKNSDIRRLHSSQIGYIAPVETPDGGNAGLIKHFASTATATVNTDPLPIINILENLDEKYIILKGDLDTIESWRLTKIFVNGNPIGSTSEPNYIVSNLRSMRRKLQIDIYTGIVWDFDNNEIKINTDGGRLIRPLYIVENNKLKITKEMLNKLQDNKGITEWNWNDLIVNGIVEYIDISECEMNVLLAQKPSDLDKYPKEIRPYTHCELHPCVLLGSLIGLIPFSEHNQAPRNLFQGQMGKQSIDVNSPMFPVRMETSGVNILFNLERPLVGTLFQKYIGFDKLPGGNNVMVAIMCYTGFNQEDSIIANKSSIDRGLFRNIKFHTFKEQTKNDEQFTKPDANRTVGINNKEVNYDKLNNCGFIPEGETVNPNDIIIGKVTTLDRNSRTDTKDQQDISVIYKEKHSGVIDRIVADNNNEEGYDILKIRVKELRIPQIGDKLSSRHGQKGIIGMVYTQEDMPFTEKGMTPDVIINPQAIPSRMTIGQLLELVGAKSSAIRGVYTDATPFTDVRPEELVKSLEKEGYNGFGFEKMRNGKTGEVMEALIFYGPTYYQRLKHVVDDKIHARATGPVTTLTQQPPEGRARNGGLKFGDHFAKVGTKCRLVYVW